MEKEEEVILRKLSMITMNLSLLLHLMLKLYLLLQ
jgi:hypothetical protein